MSARARAVLDAIDDATVIQQRNPVLFARLSREGRDCRTLSTLCTLWEAGLPTPAWAFAYVDAPATRARAQRNRRANRVAKRARRRNRRAA